MFQDLFFDGSRIMQGLVPWPPTVVGTLLLGMSVLLALRERSSRVSLAFGFLACMVSLWLLSSARLCGTATLQDAVTWARIENLGVVFIPSAMWLFTLVVTSRAGAHRWRQTGV